MSSIEGEEGLGTRLDCDPDSNPDSDHLSHMHVDCDPDSNPDLGPGARVNAALAVIPMKMNY